MADFVYNVAAKRAMDGNLDLDSPVDLRVLLLGTDAEDRDHANLAAIITAGAVESTNTGYSRQALAGDATAQDDTNDRAEYDATDPVFSSIANDGTGNIVAAIVYLYVDGTNANDIPIAHYDTNFPVTPNGSDITLQINAEGLIQYSTV